MVENVEGAGHLTTVIQKGKLHPVLINFQNFITTTLSSKFVMVITTENTIS